MYCIVYVLYKHCICACVSVYLFFFSFTNGIYSSAWNASNLLLDINFFEGHYIIWHYFNFNIKVNFGIKVPLNPDIPGSLHGSMNYKKRNLMIHEELNIVLILMDLVSFGDEGYLNFIHHLIQIHR